MCENALDAFVFALLKDEKIIDGNIIRPKRIENRFL